MSDLTPRAVDAYLQTVLLHSDAALDLAHARGLAAGLPDHAVSPLQGQFLTILTRATKAKRVLEIGTMAGYSTICFAQGLDEDGVVITLEVDKRCVAVANQTFQDTGLCAHIQLMAGDAHTTLLDLIERGTPPFDIIFIDADKPSNPAYLDAALKLSKAGTLIIGDNVVREGAVADAASTDPKVTGVRTFLNATGQSQQLIATALQTVGCKGYDGFSVALVV
jgi:predicted O-methyltransferase YrrM